MLKRLTAVVLTVCFGLFSLEVAVADVHDGDASAAEIAKATIGGGFASTSASEVPRTDSAPDAPAQPAGHTAHVCHCVHSHGGWTPNPDKLPVRSVAVQTVISLDVLAPSQVDLDIHLRPPIA